MKTVKLNSCEENQKPPEPYIWKDAKDFYRDNYGKVYHLYPNGYGEKEVIPRMNYHNNPKIVECKRVSYWSFKEEKKNRRYYIDRISIDADEGYIAVRTKLRRLIEKLNFEYWIIAGTDKKYKPQDSGNIVIMFQPMEATKINMMRFNNLVRCLNIHVGDVLNTGYAHKSPEWKGTKEKSKIPGRILDFDDLYHGILEFYNHTPEEVEKLYMDKKMCEYDKKFYAELQKGDDEINRNRISKYYYNSHKTEEQTRLLELFLTDKEKNERIRNRKATGEVRVKDKKDYIKRLIFDDYLFDYTFDDDLTDKIIPNGEIDYLDAPFSDNEWVEKNEKQRLEKMKHQKSTTGLISFRDKFNVSESEEKYWYGRIRDKLRKQGLLEKRVKDGKEYENFVLYKRYDEYIKSLCEGLGYTDEQVKHILGWAKSERMNLEIAKRRKAKERRDRIKELNELKKDGKLNYNEEKELKELTEPKTKKEKSRKIEFSNMGEYINNNISLLNYKTKNCGKYTTYYVDENNYVMTKEYVVKNYLGGRDYNMSQLTEPYNIKKISQTELLRSDGKYKLSDDVNLEVMVTRMHKKIIKDGNQVKPKKIK
jgi:hypothetical protein